MYWFPIDSAPKDGRPVIVNDTKAATPETAGIVLAKYASYPDWSGWIYCDEALQEFNPYGPEPTCWLADVPEIPETFLKELRNEYLTPSQKLCESYYLTKEDLRTIKKAVVSAQNLREVAIKESMTWSDVKTKVCAGYCLFCVVDLRLRLERQLTREGLECMLCPWLLLEEENCVNYLDHKDAIARYKRWLKELDQLIDWTEAKNATCIHTGV